MKRKLLIGTVVFFILIVALIVLAFLKRDVNFSNSNSPEVATEYFDIVNRLTPDPSRPDTSILEIGISYKDKDNTKAKRDSMKVYPTIGGINSIQPFRIMASQYFFYVPTDDKHDNSSLDLLIKFKLDSSNQVIDKSVLFKELKPITRYRWSFH